MEDMEFLKKVGALKLGKPLVLNGVSVRLSIEEDLSVDVCDLCVFHADCTESVCALCCAAESFYFDCWVYFIAA